MSAALPLPLPQPEPPAPLRPQAVPPAPPRRRRWWTAGALIAAIAAGALWYYVKDGQPPPPTAVALLKTVPAQRGNLEHRVRITGATSARNYASITAPRLRGPGSNRELNLLSLATSGTTIKQGEIVAEFDPQDTRNTVDDELAQLKDAENSIKRRIAEQAVDMENLEQQLRVAKASLDKANLDFRTTEIRTDIDRELLQLGVDEANAAYKELQTDVPQTRTSQRADLRNLEIARDMQKLRVDRYQEDLSRLTIRAPMSGLVVMQSMFQPGGDQRQIQVGDRVSPLQPFMKIIDSSTMQVEANINQTDSSKFRIGQDAIVGLDAFPDLTYKGKVYSIAALATGSMRQNYFIRTVPVLVQIQQADNKVIPDLSAWAEVLIEKADNVIIVPTGAITRDGNAAFVEVKTAVGFEKRAVTTGLCNGPSTAILEGLKEGDEVRVN